jgi:hypothetical protein
MTINAIKIEDFLRLSLNKKNIFVSDARAKNEGEYEYAIFLTERNYMDYVSNKCDSEDLIIWKTEKGKFCFSYIVEDPGVYMYKDGSGTPPSCDFVEYKENFNSLLECVKEIADFYFKDIVNQAIIDFNEK